MTYQHIALKLAAALAFFVWAYASAHNRWGMILTMTFCIAALAFGASAARDLAYIGSKESRGE
jgi:hypothetical protein